MNQNFFNESYKIKIYLSTINQSNLNINKTFTTNSAKIKNYLDNNKLTAKKYFSIILNKNIVTDEINKIEFKIILSKK